MIAIDTNVLLRRILDDDKGQGAGASRLFEGAETILITDAVLAETVWTLKGRRYKATRGGYSHSCHEPSHGAQRRVRR
ncbi:PIN domain-containing protein [Acidiferrobacter sp.]|uniref:PIN domain-containing protein n=1 Tax=Acidiferrobacter sp. TaxID=1872107 RepID=UPI00345B6146